MITRTNFADSVERSETTSHKSMKYDNVDTMMTLFEEAALFALLTEQLVRYTNTQTSADESDAISPSK